MERCERSRQASGGTPSDIPPLLWKPLDAGDSSATRPVFSVSRAEQDPVIAERRSRRRRAVIAGLIATVLLGGGVIGALHHAPAQPHTVQRQAGVKQ